MTKEDIRQFVVEVADEIYNKNNGHMYDAMSVIYAEILNNVEELITESLYRMQNNKL